MKKEATGQLVNKRIKRKQTAEWERKQCNRKEEKASEVKRKHKENHSIIKQGMGRKQ